MKKQALIIAILAAAGFTGPAASAADGTITFTGEVQGLTCVVSGGTGTTVGTGGDFSVALDKVQTSSLATAGAAAGGKRFTINLSAGSGASCPNGTRAAILFEPSSPGIDSASGNLKNTATTNPAANVEVQILDAGAGNAPIDLRLGNKSQEVTVASNTATLPFIAQYLASGGAASAGQVASSVQYSVVYP